MSNLNWDKRLLELVEDWYFLWQRQGSFSTLATVGREIARLPYWHAKFAIIARSLLEPIPDLQPKIEIQIRDFKSEDLEAVHQIDRPSQVALCRHRLARGHKGLVATYEEQVIGYAWGCDEFTSPLERIHLETLPGDMLCIDVYTAPAFRNKGVQTALVLARLRLFGDLGYQRAIAYIRTNNFPSLAVWQKVNGQVVGQVDFRRIGSWRQVKMERQDLSPLSIS